MRIPSGKVDQAIYFVAVDSTDLKTRKTGLTTFTAYRSRNGGAATAYTTPTITELSAANMPGVYSLLIDEDTTIASGSDSEEYCVHITQAAMAPVTRTIELYRREVTTGNQLSVSAAGRALSDVDTIKTQAVTCSGGVTIPAATLASTTNITSASGIVLNNGAQTITTLTCSDGIVVSRSSSNQPGISATGNGTGAGVLATSGSGATGDGFRAVAASTNGHGITGVKTGTGSDLNCTSTPLTLAKTANITGFNDIAATAIVSSGAISTSGGAVSTVTTVNGLAVNSITAGVIAADAIGASELAADAIAEIADAIWDEARAGHVTAGTFGEGIASVQGSVTGSVGSVSGAVGSVTAGVTVGTNNDKTGYRLSATGVDDVWDEATAGHTTAGTTGKALIDAGSAGDPWSTALPGAYGAGTAGNIVGTNLNATVSSVKAKTDQLTFTVANQIDANIQYVNDVHVTGNGQPGSEWGP